MAHKRKVIKAIERRGPERSALNIGTIFCSTKDAIKINGCWVAKSIITRQSKIIYLEVDGKPVSDGREHIAIDTRFPIKYLDAYAVGQIDCITADGRKIRIDDRGIRVIE